MAKTIEPGAMFHLPQLTLGGTLALAAKLLAAAKAEKKMPADLAKTAKRIKQAHDAMARAKRDRVTLAPDKSTRARLRRDEVAAWSTLQQLLAAWSKLAGTESADAAVQLAAALFSGEPTFARRRFEVAWKEADERLKLLKERNLEAAVEMIGAELFIENVERAHRASGDHLGITHRTVVQILDEQPTMKLLAEELRTIMREYVVQTTGHAVGDRKGRALAARLLAPIGEWRQVRTAKKRAPAAEVPAPLVEPPPATQPAPVAESPAAGETKTEPPPA